ncbi:unnamed protein product [Toxocara canis]|nr:unnamed protein product [Toxocara canis]
MILPIAVFCAIALTSINVMQYGSIVMIFLNWQTVVNPFITIYFIGPFRDRVRHAFPWNRGHRKLLVKTTTASRNDNGSSNFGRGYT